MQIVADLATFIAKGALTGPYRQTKCLTTGDYESWLKARGIEFGWETLHYLWTLGLLRPIAVRDDAVAELNLRKSQLRFVDLQFEPERPGRYLADLGIAVESEHSNFDRFHGGDIDVALRDSLLWHPFQVWHIDEVFRRLELIISPGAFVRGIKNLREVVDFIYEARSKQLVAISFDDMRRSFDRLLGLLVSSDPLIHPYVYGQYTHDPSEGETSEGYGRWIFGQSGAEILTAVSMTIEEVRGWHERLSLIGYSRDSFGPFIQLIRNANRDQRERLRGDALLAQTYFDIAELIRAYMSKYHGIELPAETEIAFPGKSKMNPTSDFRRLVRRLGVDAQESLHWYVEGATEYGFVGAWATGQGIDLRQAGIVLKNADGNGFFSNRKFREDLEYCRQEQIYAFVSVDEDDRLVPNPGRWVRPPVPEHVRALHQLDEDRLLPIGFVIWQPNFVEANFTLGEMCKIANQIIIANDLSVTITQQDITHKMQYRKNQLRAKPLFMEEAIVSFLQDQLHLNNVTKSLDWGELLAAYALENPTLGILVNVSGTTLRPIVKEFSRLLRAKRSVYDVDVGIHETLLTPRVKN